MLSPVFENAKYQAFLNSNERENTVDSSIYVEFFANRTPSNILEIGCGLGYVTLYLAQRLEGEALHFYPTDCQEDLLDELWKSIADRNLKNITPFYSPDESHFRFDGWLPPFSDVIFSFSLIALEDPVLAVRTILPYLEKNAAIHIIDWDKDQASLRKDDEPPNRYLRPAEMLNPAKVKYFLDTAGYQLEKEYQVKGPAFAMTYVPPKSETHE
ncbi:MAG: class I SAM-dependent methyltransferase [Candidatus Hydrogenedentota bacterium]|nr:MAG: class I SAM-dependent methyltransferase [Candidatus Hydrogenedentota bacterium]